MSLNLHLYAVADAIIEKTGKRTTIVKDFDLFQSPTVVTEKLIVLDDVDAILDGYFDYYKTSCSDYDCFDEHVNDLNKFINNHVDEGYDIIFEAW